MTPRYLLLACVLPVLGCNDHFRTLGVFDKVDTDTLSDINVIASGDINGDGKDDVLTINGLGGMPRVAVLISNEKGDGTLAGGVFNMLPLTPTMNMPITVRMASADLDGDGKAEVVVTHAEDKALYVFPNAGGQLGKTSRIGLDCSPRILQLRDINNDGRRDIVIACEMPTQLRVIPNRDGVDFSAGSYTWTWPHPTTMGISPARSLGVGSFNSDGVTDIAVSTNNNDLRILNSPAEGSDSHIVSLPNLMGGNASSVGVGDVNGNGLQDVTVLVDGKRALVFEFVSSNAYNQIAAFEVMNPMTFSTPDSGARQINGFFETDMNGDGKSDFIVTLDQPGELRLVLSKAETGTVDQPTIISYSHKDVNSFGSFVLGDIDGNGRPDIIVRNGTKVTIIPNGSI